MNGAIAAIAIQLVLRCWTHLLTLSYGISDAATHANANGRTYAGAT